MITKDGASIHGDGRTDFLIDRSTNTAVTKLTKDEALGLIAVISDAFGIGGVPSHSTYDEIHLIIEGPWGFYPKDRE